MFSRDDNSILSEYCNQPTFDKYYVPAYVSQLHQNTNIEDDSTFWCHLRQII